MNKRIGFLLVVTFITAAAWAQNTGKGAGRDFVQKTFDDWNSHNPDRVVSRYTADVSYEDVPFGMVAHGTAEFRKMAADFFTAVPDMKLELIDASIVNGYGYTEWIFSGTDVGLFKTGKKFSVRGASLFEMRGDKCIRNKDFYDAATIMRQVGVLPAVNSPAAAPSSH